MLPPRAPAISALYMSCRPMALLRAHSMLAYTMPTMPNCCTGAKALSGNRPATVSQAAYLGKHDAPLCTVFEGSFETNAQLQTHTCANTMG